MNDITDLLKMKVPTYRQAYSDRTCWLMACLSELAYIRFNPLLPNSKSKGYFLEKINSLIDENRQENLAKLIDTVAYDHQKEITKLKKETESINFELVKTFDKNGTQAILVKSEGFVALAFRGTEATSIKDIKADCKAFLTTCETGGKIHKGFNSAYLEVASDIEEELAKHEAMPLFITGHSLGGALATVAAKKLKFKKIAACYTFGAPRSANENWISQMKTPVYRIVNSADCVTMVPPAGATVQIFAWVLGLVQPAWSEKLLKHLGKYLHAGNMRYLTNCSAGNYKDVQLFYSVSFLRRVIGWLHKIKPWKAFLNDHSIGVYKRKLEIVARQRN